VCGIAGCVVPPGDRPHRQSLDAMAAALEHRGPDDHGIETVDSVGLVHTRLAIVDTSAAGHEPMGHPEGRWWLTYNGEVFNHAQLRAELPAVAYRGTSDAETLLHALARWGEDAIPRCNGLFAYAALDLERRRLLLVRDRFGVKPLYFARHRGALWFASQIGALLAAGIPRRPRPDLLGHAMTRSWVNGPLTLLRGIHRVLPGTVVSVDLDSLETTERRWYDPADAVDPDIARELESSSREDACRRVERCLRTSVRRRLMADVPVGAMCSGGIDSGLISAFAADEQPDLRFFNASVTDQPAFDEGGWAAKVAQHLGLELQTVRMTAASWRADLVNVVRHVEYPLNHESSVPMSQIAAMARDAGVKVLLSGEGADELFGGYGWRHHREYGDFRARERPLRRAARALRGALPVPAGSPDIPLELGSPAAEAEGYEEEVLARVRQAYGHHPGSRGRLESALASDLGCYLPHLLNRQDKTTMLASIETRVPFLDPDMVSLALNLPLEARVEPDHKAVLRDLARIHLPPGVAERPKVGFGFDVQRYISDAARPEFLEEGSLRDVLEVPSDGWRQAIARASGHHVMLLWTGEIWCRAFLEGQSTGRIEADLWADPS
jgi:asparagine synthase (glutamine-hydrolysing)